VVDARPRLHGADPEWLRIAIASIYALGTLAMLLWLRPFTWALAAPKF